MRDGERLAERGGDTAQQIEGQEPAVSHAVLDVIAEDPEIEHVAGDVQKAAVEKHRGDDRYPREVRRNQAVGEDEVVDVVAERELIQKHQRIDDDQRDGDVRRRARGDDVAEWDHRDGVRSSVFGLQSTVYSGTLPTFTPQTVDRRP